MTKSTLREAVLKQQRGEHGESKIQEFIDSLDEETREELEELLHDRRIQTRALWKTLKEFGLRAGETTFRVYRNERLDSNV